MRKQLLEIGGIIDVQEMSYLGMPTLTDLP